MRTTDIYGKPIRLTKDTIIVSYAEAERLRRRAAELALKCTCPACNPPRNISDGN